jgi:dipeptidyl aminopeptidase/acylaminoacyl peptidase
MTRRSRFAAAVFFLAAMCLALLGDTGPRDAPITEGIPSTPHWLEASELPYTYFRSTRFVDWHPTRLEMLVETYRPHAGQLHRVLTPGGHMVQLSHYRDWVHSAMYPPKRGDYLILTKDRANDELYQKYRLDLDTGRTTRLTDGLSRNFPAIWSKTGKYMAYLCERPRAGQMELFLVNPLDPRTRQWVATLPGEGWSLQSWSPDDQWILLQDFQSMRETHLWLLDLATRRRILLRPRVAAGPVFYGRGRISRDRKGIYLLTDQGSEFFRLAYLDLASRRLTFLTQPISGDVTTFVLTQDGRTLAFVTSVEGFDSLHLMDLVHHWELPCDLQKGVIGNIVWHNDNRHLGFTYESARHAPDAYCLDARTGVIQRWTVSSNRMLHSREFSEPELIHWRSFDGRKIPGFLYRPPARFAGRRPVWIVVHGGPEAQIRPDYQGGDNFFLNVLGVALIRPNIRGSTGYGKTLVTLDDGLHRDDAIRDIGALLDWIRTRRDLDPDRVMVSGGSYGGYVALSVAARYNDRIRCALAEYAPSNLATLLQGIQFGKDSSRAEFGDERDPKMQAYLERIAPVNNARKITRPVFLACGANDARVPVSETQQMLKALRRCGTPLWYLRAPGEGHGFRGSRGRGSMFDAIVLFMKRYLLP